MNYKKKYNKYKSKYLKLKKKLGVSGTSDEDFKELVQSNLIAIQPINGNLNSKQKKQLYFIETFFTSTNFINLIELFKHDKNITNINHYHVDQFIHETLSQLNKRFIVIETLYKNNQETLRYIINSIYEDENSFKKLQEEYKKAYIELKKRQHVGYKGQ